jgi:hypothetical protein
MSTKWITIQGTPKPSAMSSACSSNIHTAPEPFTNSDATVPLSLLPKFYSPFSVISNPIVLSQGSIFLAELKVLLTVVMISPTSAFAVSTTLQSR